MKILIAEDDPTSLLLLKTLLTQEGYELEAVEDGESAWAALCAPAAPQLAVLDWMMPQMDGIQVCRRVRAAQWRQPPYLILLTALDRKEDIVIGLEAGANDYITKPFHKQELLARVRVGERVVHLQNDLAHRVQELEQALSQVRTLQGMLPICANCKKIRDDEGYWHRVEEYISAHSDAVFTHGICPECMVTLYGIAPR
ncbi:MAG: response regulator transcription factor [Chloroflexi bacterium]|nr:response regulator transcription factor [Chloroflexota bacterium]